TAGITVQSGHQLASLTLRDVFTGTLTLQGPLTLNNGGTVAGGNINPTAGGQGRNIFVTGGFLRRAGGNINHTVTGTTSASTFSLSGDAVARFEPTVAGGFARFGSNLSIASFSVLQLQNSNTTILLVNRPTITNWGTIDISVSNPTGIQVAAT